MSKLLAVMIGGITPLCPKFEYSQLNEQILQSKMIDAWQDTFNLFEKY